MAFCPPQSKLPYLFLSSSDLLPWLYGISFSIFNLLYFWPPAASWPATNRLSYSISVSIFSLPYLFLARPRLDSLSQTWFPVTAFHFQFSVCRTFFWPDQDLIPCPRLDFLLWHFVFNFNLPYPFLARPRLDSLFPALISCYGISVSISKLPYSGPRLLFSFFMALPHLLCSAILPRYFDLYLWARNKFMVLASCSDTSQDYSFGRLDIHPPPLPLHLNS